MSFNTRGRWPNRRHDSKGQRKLGNAGRTSRRKVRATNVRVQTLPISQIKLNRRNCKTHPGKQIDQLVNSMVAFGFTNCPAVCCSNSGSSAGGTCMCN